MFQAPDAVVPVEDEKKLHVLLEVMEVCLFSCAAHSMSIARLAFYYTGDQDYDLHYYAAAIG